MAVNLFIPSESDIHPVAGVKIGIAEAGIRKANRRDLTVVTLASGSAVAGVFTRNRFCAAPVQVCREHLAAGSAIRALVINTGNANAGTGEDGLVRARATCLAADAVSLLAAGCASNAPTSTNYSTQADASTYGTIENIQVVRVDPTTSGAGAVAGGLVGDQLHRPEHAGAAYLADHRVLLGQDGEPGPDGVLTDFLGVGDDGVVRRLVDGQHAFQRRHGTDLTAHRLTTYISTSR